ncbi:MAG: hypothetical protein IPK00_00775 [Deltaproteobacteria bacterium]|nr:hypothetical protein [Deltaproteobacteria bacterium]
MKRFVFRLERVLGIRRFELERARHDLALVEAEAGRLAAVAVDAERRWLEGQRRLEEETVTGADGAALALRARAVRAGRAKWMYARMAVEAFEPKRVRARELVRRCRARVESLEKLHDRRADLHRRQALAAEQSELEELSIARFARSSLLVGLVCLLFSAPFVARAESAKASAVEAAGAAEGSARSKGESDAALPDATAALLSGPGFSKGVDLILSEVRAREVEIARRELELGEREAAVKELEAMVAERAGELEKIRGEVEARILAWTRQGQDRIEQLSGVYAVMPPAEAADLLAKLDLDLAVSIIQKMKKKVSASVLAAMKPERALLVSRRILQPLDPATDAPPARPY